MHVPSYHHQRHVCYFVPEVSPDLSESNFSIFDHEEDPLRRPLIIYLVIFHQNLN